MRDGSDPSASEPVRRLTDIEELSNLHVIHPLANRLTPLLRDAGIAANAVSLAGMACGVMAGVAYFHYQDWRWCVAGFVLMILWHVMDGADGQLARLTHTQSETGRILDGVCDYVTFIAVYVSFAWRLQHPYGDGVWLLLLISGACHAVQSGAYEAQRQEYEYWACGRDSKNIIAPAARRHGRVARALDRFYGSVQFAAIGSTVAFHRLLDARRDGIVDLAAFRQRYAATFAPSVRRWAVLSANYRTLGIFICALLGMPIVYFVFEIMGFSAIMALLTWRLGIVRAGFVAQLAAAGPASGRAPEEIGR